MVCVGILAFSVASRSFITGFIAVPVTASAWFVFRNTFQSPFPRWALNTLLIAALLSLVQGFTGELSDVVPAVGQYIVYLQFIKLFESRNPRDQGQLIALSLILTVGSVLTSVTIDLGIMLLVYLPLAFYTIVLFQLFAGYWRQSNLASKDQADYERASKRVRQKRLPKTAVRSVRRLVILSTTAILVMASAIFVVIPRVGEGFLGSLPEPRGRAMTGFNDSIQLGSTTNINESLATVFEVRVFPNNQDRQILPLDSARYLLRGSVLDYYEQSSRTWTRVTSQAASSFKVGSGIYRGTGIQMPSSLTRSRFEFNVPIASGRNLFLPWWAVGISIESNPPFYYSARDGIAGLASSIRSLNYNVLAVVDQAGSFQMPDELDQSYLRKHQKLENPFAEGPVRELAMRIAPALIEQRDLQIDSHPNDREIAEVFRSYLEQEYSYTLEPPPVPADIDPIEYFLFDGKQGHCEYFASALAALCRSVGIHARVAVGYVATEYDRDREVFVVRERHAHAWTDVRVSPGRWVEIDPSPRETLETYHAPPKTILSRIQDFIETIDMFWIDSIVAFDDSRQREIISTARDRELMADIAKAIGQGPTEDTPRKSPLAYFAQVTAIILAITASLILVRSLAKQWKSKTQDVAVIEPIEAYRKAIKLLERSGFPKPVGLPPHRHADCIRDSMPDAARAFDRVIVHMYQVAFNSSPEREEANAALRDLESELQRQERLHA